LWRKKKQQGKRKGFLLHLFYYGRGGEKTAHQHVLEKGGKGKKKENLFFVPLERWGRG